MYDYACAHASDDSQELTGRTRSSTKDIVNKAVGALLQDSTAKFEKIVRLETKDLCTTQSVPWLGYEDFLQYVLERLVSVLKIKFAKSGGQLSVCIHEIKRKEDRHYFPTTFDVRNLNGYVGISLRVVLKLMGSRSENDSDYESLFCAHNEDSCFSSLVMDEMKKRGIILKTNRHPDRKSGVGYTLFFPKETQTIQ